MSDACKQNEIDRERMARIVTAMMAVVQPVEPHDLAWLFTLAKAGLDDRLRVRNHAPE